MRRPLKSLFALSTVVLLSAAVASGCKTTGSQAAGPVTYRIRIQQGDTLAGIAQKYDTTWKDIAKLNGIAPGTAPKAGTVLRIQPGPGGHVAGLERAPARTARAGSGTAKGDVASPDEFSEADLPDDAAAPNRSGSGGKKKGFLFGDDEASVGSGQYIWPVRGEISSKFGPRSRDNHQGLDIRAPEGTPVWAAEGATVEFAGRKRGYGKIVILAHQDGKRTYYAHLSSILVGARQRVSQGAVIGKVGKTGNATGYHLHFEVRNRQDESSDPQDYLPDEATLATAGI
jgi:murein DD-endopeptidase MepM/ murein hydrolase activator NlpD